MVSPRDFAGSLLHRLDERESTVNLLIGSRKFTEGCSSWRVSTMGLMNIGKSEGSQIIQLFGRGFRLQGYQGSLKRSSKNRVAAVDTPIHRRVGDTRRVRSPRRLHGHFRGFLSEEGLPSDETEEILLPVRTNWAPLSFAFSG